MNMEPIDFVLPWVDGSDPLWRAEKAKYDGTILGDNAEVRYRDWEILPYLFRGFEQFTPWVRKIHFVTWGHLPSWLNIAHPKLNIVRHVDYIPPQYLPTFNSHTIELNFHRINGLADHFVYFNDDQFIIRPMKPEDFFRNGLPCDVFSLNTICFKYATIGHILASNIEIINAHFKKNAQFRQNITKWLNYHYGFRCLARTMLLMPWSYFSGFYYQHIPCAYLKQTYELLWELEGNRLEETCLCKFRGKTNVNQWIMEFWQLASGAFFPTTPNRGHCYNIKERNFKAALRAVRNQKYMLLCLNDTPKTKGFEKKKEKIKSAFERVFPEKSSYEI